MAEITEYIRQATGAFWGESIYYVWFFAAVALIIFLEKSPVTKRTIGIYPIVVLLALMYSFIAYNLIQKYTTGIWQYYARLFSMIPLPVTLGLGSVLLIDAICSIRIKKKDRSKLSDEPVWFSHGRAAMKLILTGCCCGAMVFGGNYTYKQSWFKPAQNPEKVPADAIEICRILHRDEGVTIAASGELPRYIRQIDACFYMPYGRYVNKLGKELSQTNPDPDYVMAEAGKEGCDYIIVANNTENLYQFQLFAYEPYAVQGDYLIYEVKDVPRTINTYNRDRQLVIQTVLDENNEPGVNAAGYHSAMFEYDRKGSLQSELYYDLSGAQIGQNGKGAEQYNDLMRFHHPTDGVTEDATGEIIFTTDTPGNLFSLIHFQLYNTGKDKCLATFGEGASPMEIRGEYVHELPEGMYYLRLKANTNLSDEYIDSLVYLKHGDRIIYNYDIEDISSDWIIVKNLSVHSPNKKQETETSFSSGRILS